MTLRTRLFATSGLIAVPLAVGLFLIDERLRLGSMEQALQTAVQHDVSSGLKDRCESGFEPPPGRRPGAAPVDALGRRGGAPPPGRGGLGPGRGGGRGYELFTYSEVGTSAAIQAPALPPTPISRFWVGGGRGIQLRFSIGGAGDCAQGLARMPPRPGQLRDQLVAVTLVVLSVLAGAWLAAGPVISKMRRLADDVRRSAASTYQQPVHIEGDDEVAALALAFNDAGASVRARLLDVRAREDTLRQFVADTTHDVAVPLTVLQGNLSNLDAALTGHGETDPAARNHVRAAMKETHYMASLLRNLSVATKLGEACAPLELGPVDLSALVERVIERHRPIARASSVDLDFGVPDAPLVWRADATLLEQAVSNLIDNAIRHNHTGGHVAVVLDRAGTQGFVLSVTDDGPGVTEAELAKLTSRWFRGSDARTRQPDGKGLGLAIVSEACGRLGLRLAFSRPGAGGLKATIETS